MATSVKTSCDTDLNIALKRGHYQDAWWLIVEPRTDINKRGLGGLTSLMWAAANGYERMVEKLIERGAEVNTRDDENRSALDHARTAATSISEVYTRIVTMLIENGAEERASVGIQLRLDGKELLLRLEGPSDLVIVKEIGNASGPSLSYLNVANAVEIYRVARSDGEPEA